MKVILQQDVANLGSKFSVADVPNGYALNKLIPSGKATVATAANLKALQKRAAQQEQEVGAHVELLQSAVAVLRATPLTVAAGASENGQLFQALSKEQITTAANDAGAAIAPAMIDIPQTIKSVGTHEINLVGGGEQESVTIEVVAA